MRKKPESAALQIEIVKQLGHEELVKLVLTQQQLIEKLQLELEKLKLKQPSNSQTSSKLCLLKVEAIVISLLNVVFCNWYCGMQSYKAITQRTIALFLAGIFPVL